MDKDKFSADRSDRFNEQEEQAIARQLRGSPSANQGG